MKKLQTFAAFGIILCCSLVLAACSKPRTPDSPAAGVYHQHIGEIKMHVWIQLHSNGTWSTGHDGKVEINYKSGTFELKSNNKISLYSGHFEIMYGTLEDGVLTLRVWQFTGWLENIVLIKDTPA